jgi:hypothetical protein
MTTFTGKGVDLFRWTAVRGALKLEAKGIRVRSGRKVAPQIKQELGLRKSASLDELLAAVDQKIEDIKAQIAPGDICE